MDEKHGVDGLLCLLIIAHDSSKVEDKFLVFDGIHEGCAKSVQYDGLR